jgi:hypothetical protein
MRRNYISPEYQHKRVYGTYNMIEESNFFAAKMIDIEDSISIGFDDIIFYQNNKGEQLDFSIESSIKSNNYSPVIDKKELHKIQLEDAQAKYELDKNAKWYLTIEIKKILLNYIFALMKRYRSFEGIRNDMTLEGNVNEALKKYILNNIYDRYRLRTIDVYLRYNDLKKRNALRYVTTWNADIVNEKNKIKKTRLETSVDNQIVKIYFTQEQPADSYNFDYFFIPIFDKI